MANRLLHRNTGTQSTKAVDYIFNVLGVTGATGTIGASIGEGDPEQSYVSVQRGTSGITGVTGTTGTYLLSTNDSFIGHIFSGATVRIAGQTSGWTVTFGIPMQQVSTQAQTQINLATGQSNIPGCNGSWLVPFTVYNSGVATDLIAGQSVYVHLRFRDSITNP